MTVRIPTDEKEMLQAIADHLDITLSDVVVKAVRDFIAGNSSAIKKAPAKAKVSKTKAAKPTKALPKKSPSKTVKSKGR